MLALASPVRAQDATEHRIVDKPLELTIHMHFRDKYTWKEDWPVAQEVARLTGIKLKDVASKATANSREAFNLMIASGGLPTSSAATICGTISSATGWKAPSCRSTT